MFKLHLVLLLSICFTSFAQGPVKPKSKVMIEQTSTEKWIHAVVNLEVRKSSKKDVDEASAKHDRKEISFQDYVTVKEKITSFNGTAIYLIYNDRHYLLTARHVLEQLNADEELDAIADNVLLIENGNAIDSDDKYSKKYGYEMLFYLGVGAPGTRPYLFSSKGDDLAAIWLDHRFSHKGFVETLNQKGYVPITIDDIDETCQLISGQELTAFGFPGDLSSLKPKGLSPGEMNFHSDFVSLPVVSFGSVYDPLSDEHHFSGGIYVSPGSSGGPIVSKNKLVGIVSRQEVPLKMINTSSLNIYIQRELHFIKSSQVISLIKKLDDKVKFQDEINLQTEKFMKEKSHSK